MTAREALYRLIDELPDDALPAVERYLAAVRDDPVYRAAMAAPRDDEGSSPEEDAEADAAWARYRRGEYVANGDLRRELGW